MESNTATGTRAKKKLYGNNKKVFEAMLDKNTFKDKIILITGGRSGIGYTTAKKMLQLGAKVIIVSRKEDALKEAAEKLKNFGEVSSMPCDIRDTYQIKNLVTFIKEKYNQLDILINNAGGQFPTLAAYTSDKGWESVIDNNLNGTFYMSREMANAFFIPQNKGVIVNIIANIYNGFPGMIHTGAARAGVENMSKTLAQEWSAYNIRVNCVAPGIVDSSGLSTYPKAIQNMFAEAKKQIPMQRFATEKEVANVICFFASDLSSYCSGTTLYVDGAQRLNFDNMQLVHILRNMTKEEFNLRKEKMNK